MRRYKLKCGGRRKKAFMGIGESIAAGIQVAGMLAAAGLQVKATKDAAKQQEKAILDTGKQNADTIKQQTETMNKVENEKMAMTRTMNQEQQDIQKELLANTQLQAGQQNLDSRIQNTRMQVKAGGSPNRFNLKSPFFYGGARMPFKVTDGGGVLPIDIDTNGYGLYEIIGNDHEHYHKAPGGKNKTGVGIKFTNGGIVEGEGNQNTDKGEFFWVDPNDALFISKHDIGGFNPREAVVNGMHPKQAFAYQQLNKSILGINDDGTKAKCGKRKSIRHKAWGGTTFPISYENFPLAGSISNVAANVNIPSSISSPDKYKFDYSKILGDNNYGGNTGGSNVMNNYGGAIMNTAGNLIGAGLSWIGNRYAANKVAAAQEKARQYAIDAIDQMHGIDLSQIDANDYDAESTLAVVRSADTNINPQLERNRRLASAEKRDIDRNTLSSAASLTRKAEVDDRRFQRSNELEAYKHNEDEKIYQQNAQTLTQVAQANADRKLQARQNYLNDKFKYLAYNADVDNNKLQLKAQINSDARNSIANILGGSIQAGLQGFGNAITNSASGFASTFNGINNNNANLDLILASQDPLDADYFINYLTKKRKSLKV